MSLSDKLNTPQTTQPVTLPAMLKQNSARLKTIAPAGFDINRFSAALMTQVRTNPKLAECNQLSIMGAFINSTQLGLEPSASLGHCYFVPFKGECQLVIGYRGMIELAYRPGKVLSIAARTIHQADHFDYSYGITDVLEHKPATGDRGALIGVYAVAKLIGGGVHFEVLDLADQWKGAIKQFTGLDCGMIGGGKNAEGKQFTIGLVQSLVKRDLSQLEYGLIIADECHNAPASQFYSVINGICPVQIRPVSNTTAQGFAGIYDIRRIGRHLRRNRAGSTGRQGFASGSANH